MDTEFDSGRVMEQGLVTFTKMGNGPWMEDGQQLKPCWTESSFGRSMECLINYAES